MYGSSSVEGSVMTSAASFDRSVKILAHASATDEDVVDVFAPCFCAASFDAAVVMDETAQASSARDDPDSSSLIILDDGLIITPLCLLLSVIW